MAQNMRSHSQWKPQRPHNACELPLHKIKLERKQAFGLAVPKEWHKELKDKGTLVADDNGDISETSLGTVLLGRGRDTQRPSSAVLRPSAPARRRDVPTLHGEQLAWSKVGVKPNQHKHGESHEMLERELLRKPAQAAQRHGITVS